MPYSEPHSAFPVRRARAGIVTLASSGPTSAAGGVLWGSFPASLSALALVSPKSDYFWCFPLTRGSLCRQQSVLRRMQTGKLITSKEH